MCVLDDSLSQQDYMNKLSLEMLWIEGKQKALQTTPTMPRQQVAIRPG